MLFTGRRLALAIALLGLLALDAPGAEARITWGCYDRDILGVDEHEVYGGGNWYANGPHGWLWNDCDAVHTQQSGGGGGGPRPG